ncbi:hypothetical protein KSP40_PGU000107 [Platanthera guangdongensis]|uniref:Uncharacterized protein n=1 Tax=Platanthera guangdongensis TaxID=2320717 RepID=A0ABR2LHU9_9ASPA
MQLLSPTMSLLDQRGGASQQRIKYFDFVLRAPPQVGFEIRGMGDYPVRFGEHVHVVCASERSRKKRLLLRLRHH